MKYIGLPIDTTIQPRTIHAQIRFPFQIEVYRSENLPVSRNNVSKNNSFDKRNRYKGQVIGLKHSVLILFLLALVLLNPKELHAGILLTFDFAGQAGNETSVEPNFSESGITGSAIIRGSGLSAASNADRFNSNNWTLSDSPDENDYLEFSLTPSSGYSISVSELIIKHQRSATGPTRMILKCSNDSYISILDESKLIPDVTTTQTDTFLLALSGIESIITFRIYGYFAESSSGTWGPGDGSGNDIILSGALNDLTSVNQPESFAATPESSTEIKLTWLPNASGDQVLIAWSDTSEFGHPVNGTEYHSGDTLSGGGTVLYLGNATESSHTSLTPATIYYYTAWSYNSALNFSAGVDTFASTLAPRPDQPACGLTLSHLDYSSLELTWEFQASGHPGQRLLLFVSQIDTLSDPSDGNWYEEDTDLADGAACFHLDDGVTNYTLSGLTRSTTYYIAIYACSNSGSQALYNTTCDTERISATTTDGPTLFISEVTAPSVTAGAKYVEIYNYGDVPIDLAAHNVYLARQTNGGTTWGNIALTGLLSAQNCYVVAYNTETFRSTYGFSAHQVNGAISGNGNDAYFLYFGGDRNTGILLDCYGVIDEDGTGTAWEYTVSKAERNNSVSQPSTNWNADEWTIHQSTPQRCTPGRFPATVWNGGIDSQWSEQANWDNSPPDESTDVLIWSGAPTFPDIETSISIRNLIMQNNTQLNHQENLSITDSTTIEHTVVFSSSSSQPDHWQYISLPFYPLTAETMISSNPRIDCYLASYNNLTSEDFDLSWEFVSSAETLLLPGSGYAMALVNDSDEEGDEITSTEFTLQINGTLSNPTDCTYPLTRNGSNGWNLIGNQWLAPIDWTYPSIDMSLLSGAAAYLYDPSANSGQGAYLTIQADGSVSPEGSSPLIPPKAAFFVLATGAGSFDISGLARTNSVQNSYKSSCQSQTISLKLTSDSCSDETVIRIDPTAKNPTDLKDASKLIHPNKSLPQIYTTNPDGFNSVINHISEFPVTLKLSIYNPVAKELYLFPKFSPDWDPAIKTSLIDLLEGTIFNLQTDTMILLNIPSGEWTNRFLLSFDDKRNVQVAKTSDWKIKMINHRIEVYNSSPFDARIKVMNTCGQTVGQKRITNSDNTFYPGPGCGPFIIQITKNGQDFITKLFICCTSF